MRPQTVCFVLCPLPLPPLSSSFPAASLSFSTRGSARGYGVWRPAGLAQLRSGVCSPVKDPASGAAGCQVQGGRGRLGRRAGDPPEPAPPGPGPVRPLRKAGQWLWGGLGLLPGAPGLVPGDLLWRPGGSRVLWGLNTLAGTRVTPSRPWGARGGGRLPQGAPPFLGRGYWKRDRPGGAGPALAGAGRGAGAGEVAADRRPRGAPSRSRVARPGAGPGSLLEETDRVGRVAAFLCLVGFCVSVWLQLF